MPDSEVARPAKVDRLVSIDLKNIEYRLLAHFTNDPGLIKIFVNDEDFHGSVANHPLLKRHGITRKQAKIFNFAKVYGASNAKLALSIGVSEKVCRQVSQAYSRAYPWVDIWIAQVRRQVRKNGGVRNPFGRWRALPPDKDYVGPNTKIQGTAADLFKIIINRVTAYLRGKRSRLLLPVHDELLINWVLADGNIIHPILGLVGTWVSATGRPLFRVPITGSVAWSETSWAAKKKMTLMDELEFKWIDEVENNARWARFDRTSYRRSWRSFFFDYNAKTQGAIGLEEIQEGLKAVDGLLVEKASEKKLAQYVEAWTHKHGAPIAYDPDGMPTMPRKQAPVDR